MTEPALTAFAQAAVAAAMRAGASAADAMAVRSRQHSVSVRRGVLESLQQEESTGLGLRVFAGGASALVSTSDLRQDKLAALAAEAFAIAQAAPQDPYAGLADTALLAPAQDWSAGDETLLDPDALLALARECEAAGLAHPAITNSLSAEAASGHVEEALATSSGFHGRIARGNASLSAVLIAGEGDQMQRDYAVRYALGARHLPPPAAVGREAAERAASKCNPRKISTRSAPVYFEPRAARALLQAFAGAINGAAVARGTSFLRSAMDQAVFAPNITITDDPLREGGLASRPFDGEGVRSARRTLIESGHLRAWFLDSRSARQLGLASLGHAARGWSGAPYPTSSNLTLEAGIASPQELFANVGDGLYVRETFGHGANLITGDYSAGVSGVWIEGGEAAYPVAEVTIAGHLREMFATLLAANDLEYLSASNAPTLAIPSMTIAGTS